MQSNQDGATPRSTTPWNQPVPPAAKWMTVTAQMKFVDKKVMTYNSKHYTYTKIDSGLLDTLLYFGLDCSTTISNMIHVDNLSLVLVTEYSWAAEGCK